MTTIARYINLLLVKRLAVVLFAIWGFASVFDLLDAIDDVTKDAEFPVLSVLAYLAVRAPSLLSQILPVIALLGGLYFITDLMRNHELMVIWSMGRSTRQVIIKLMPVLVLLAAGKFVLDDQLVPRSVEMLREWKVGAFKRTEIVGSSGNEIWLKSGRDIVRVGGEADQAEGILNDVTLFIRDDAGRLTQRVDAVRAQLIDDNLWQLLQARISGRGALTADDDGSVVWRGWIDLGHITLLARPARELMLLDQWRIIQADGFSIRAIDPYVTWLNHRLAGSLIPSLLLALVLALARSFSRSGNAMAIFVPAIAVGFSFLIINGVVIAIGEVGVVPPVLAAWGPVALLFTLISILLLRTNRLSAMRLVPSSGSS